MIESTEELELCALASGSSGLEELAASARRRARQVGGDPTELLERAAARRRPERGRRLRGDPRDALGARARRDARAREQGEPRRGRRARARGAPARAAARCSRSTASTRRSSSASKAGSPDSVHSLVLTASGGPFRGRTRERARRRDRRGGARAPDVEHGAEDHDRLGDAREQGARADRGALPLRAPLRPDRGGRPPDLDRPRARPLPRRRRARAPRLSRHARADLVRAHLPGAGGDARAAARPRAGSRSSSRRPTSRRSRCSRSHARAGERGGTYPCAYNAANEVAVAAFLDGRIAFLGIAELVESALDAVDGAPARDLDELVEADDGGAAAGRAGAVSVK